MSSMAPNIDIQIVKNNNNNNNESEDPIDDDGEEDEDVKDMPWAWFKAFQDIVARDPPKEIPQPPVAVLPWLYLAPITCVRGPAATTHLQELGITHVLSTNRMPPKVLEGLYWELRSCDIDQHYVPAVDQLSYNMMAHWEECRDYLQECLDQSKSSSSSSTNEIKGKALVHCSAGMNRSGTIAAAAMMHFGKMTLLEVAESLKAKRGYVLNNASFVKQLVLFAARNGHLGDPPEGYDNEPIAIAPATSYQSTTTSSSS